MRDERNKENVKGTRNILSALCVFRLQRNADASEGIKFDPEDCAMEERDTSRFSILLFTRTPAVSVNYGFSKIHESFLRS